MGKIKIIVVDDLKEIQNYFKMILNREADMEVIATASSGKESCKIILEKKPDIVLMDVQMETETAGIDAIEYIKQRESEIKFIILTIHEEDEILFKAYAAGAVDYIVKDSSIVDILNSIRNTYNNNLAMRPEIASKIIAEFSRLKKEQSNLIYTLNIVSKLTNTEFDILRDIYFGSSYKKIAQERCVEEVTIRTHINKILKKFNQKRIKDVVKILNDLNIFDIYSK